MFEQAGCAARSLADFLRYELAPLETGVLSIDETTPVPAKAGIYA